MPSYTVSPDTLAVEEQIKNRVKVEKYMSRIKAMLRIASIAAEHESIDIDIQTIRDYIHTLDRLALITQKTNGKGLDILIDENTAFKEEADCWKTIANKIETPRIANTIKFIAPELECVEQLMKGKTLCEIGNDCNMSANSVDFHAVNAIRKLMSLTSLRRK